MKNRDEFANWRLNLTAVTALQDHISYNIRKILGQNIRDQIFI
jgi:hypothetical protein